MRTGRRKKRREEEEQEAGMSQCTLLYARPSGDSFLEKKGETLPSPDWGEFSPSIVKRCFLQWANGVRGGNAALQLLQ